MGIQIACASITVILLIYIAYLCGCRSIESSYLQGFWETNSEFNSEAGLQLFSMYIGEPSGAEYPSYILMIEEGDDQTILINEPLVFNLSESILNKFSYGGCREYKMTLKNLETQMLPHVLKMRYYPSTCKIVLSDHKQVYAVFFKNPVISELEQIKKENSTKINDKIDNSETNVTDTL
jgi:hypothetical protein